MKQTGVTRKIDELGRIVIPKEIRKNLGIRDGEDLEIYIENDAVILKKHSQMHTYKDLANSLCNTVYSILDIDIIISDREKIIASSGKYKRLINKRINNRLINLIDKREIFINKEIDSINIAEDQIRGYITIVPIISSIDSIGLVILINKNNESCEKYAKLIARIIAEKIDIY